MDLNLVAQDLFDEIKSRYSHLTLGDESAQVTTDPQLARFFKFNWNNYPVSISIDEETLRLIYNKELSDSVTAEDQESWYSFARSMREFAITHNLGFKPTDIQKVDLKQNDFDFISQVNTVQENRMHGTTRTTYRPLDKTKMIIRHSKVVDESVPGSRSRNIDVIFIENSQGERFRFPYNYLHGARAMQMHVAKGGNPYDEIGEAIVEQVANIGKLRKFTQYANRMKMVDENTEPYITSAYEKIKETKKLLTKLQNSNTYETAIESFTKQNTLGETNLEYLQSLFTKEIFDEDLIEAFKLLPVVEFDQDSMDRTDVMKQTSTASRYVNYVNSWLQNPANKLILKKDDSYDELQNNLRSQQKDTDLKLMTILRDIATRFLSANPEDDSIVNFASDMESQLSQAGELFSKPNPEIKAMRGTAIKLANRYLEDMKRIKTDDAYKDEVRKSPEDIKAFKDIKGKEIGKGKLAKQYKRKYKDESEQFEAWINAHVSNMNLIIEDDEVEKSEYQDAFSKPKQTEINRIKKLAGV